MPSNDPTLNIMTDPNRKFGTIRLAGNAEASGYTQNMMFAQRQLPSSYFFEGNYSARLRPLHEDGFAATQRGYRLYFAVAGLSFQNPRAALTKDWQKLPNAPGYKSKYYVYERLGVSAATVAGRMLNLRNNAEPISTENLVQANRNRAAAGNTRILYVYEGELKGTFWAHKHSGWDGWPYQDKAEFQRFENRFLPLCIMDFSIRPGDLNAAQEVGNAFAQTLALIPESRRRVHPGHPLLSVDEILQYYLYSSETVDGITGQMIWNKLLNLSQSDQDFEFRTNNNNSVENTVVSGAQYLSRTMILEAAAQRSAIYKMINAFQP